MATPPFPKDDAEALFAAIEQALREGYAPIGRSVSNREKGALRIACERLGIPRNSCTSKLDAARRTLKRDVNWSLYEKPETPPQIYQPPPAPTPDIQDAVHAALKKQPSTLDELAQTLHCTPGQALDAVLKIKASGFNVSQRGESYTLDRITEPAFVGATRLKYISRPDNTFLFGVAADSHLGSKYERLDALNDIYDRFDSAKVDRVFHCGNWIEGEASFNRGDISIHGMDAQLRYLVRNYPQRPGLVTYAVTGDDHEGWYSQKGLIDIGRRAEQDMRDAGRTDWVNLGYMEAYVELVNANTGKSSILAVVHPGGGSAYADSYVVQKIIESLDGGEKPAVALYGHYHKMLAGEYRNVFWVLVPSTKDQDIFMRKKRLRSVVGGGIIGLEQDPETGAITGMTPKLWRYFNRGYYRSWSHSDDVELPARENIG